MGNAGYSGEDKNGGNEGGLLERVNQVIRHSGDGLGNDELIDLITREFYEVKLQAVREGVAENQRLNAEIVRINANLKPLHTWASATWLKLSFFIWNRKTIAAFIMQEYERAESNRGLLEEAVREELELTRQEREMNCPRDEMLEAIRGKLLVAYNQGRQSAANYMATLRESWQLFYPQKPFPDEVRKLRRD